MKLSDPPLSRILPVQEKVTCTNPISSEHEIDGLTNSAICMIGEQTHQLPSQTHSEKNAYIYIYIYEIAEDSRQQKFEVI